MRLWIRQKNKIAFRQFYFYTNTYIRNVLKGASLMSSEFVIKTNHLSKDFGEKRVIKDCNMNVKQGSIYCLVGKNGAGKTTLFKILLGLTSATNGKAIILNVDSKVGNLDVLRRTGSIIDNPVFYENLSAKQNLKIHLEYMGIKDDDRIEKTLIKAGLKDITNRPVSTFSTGMRQRLAIARAIIHEPELLILDEPINGMDPLGIREMRELFHKLSDQGISILMSSHLLSEVELVADYIGFLNNGTLNCEVQTKDIKKSSPGGLEDYFIKVIHEGIGV